MENEQILKTLQLFYAGLLVDAVANFDHVGALETVTAKKETEQVLAAPGQLKQMGITTPADLFRVSGAVFGCAPWTVKDDGKGNTLAEAKSCLACAVAKKRGSPAPCRMYCINPFKALAGAMTPSRGIEVLETLWEGKACVFRVTPASKS